MRLSRFRPRLSAGTFSGLLAFSLLLGAGSTGCVSARMSDRKSNRLFQDGKYDQAASRLKEGLKKQGEGSKDELLYLLDVGLALHAAGKYEESNRYLLKADKIAEIKDYTSLSRETATLLTSDNIKHYKGEDFEKVLINTYLAMNFALMGEFESAQVEARRVNRKLYMMVFEGKRKYKQNAFARYLSAVLYEATRSWNDAYVDYKLTHELMPEFPEIGRDLWRMAWLMGMRDEMNRWDREFSLTEEDHKAARALSPKAKKGEIIVLYENGISPIKRPHPNWHSIPQFYPRFNPVQKAKVSVNGKIETSTHILHDVETTAIQNLEEKYAGIIAKKMAGVVAKEVVADQIGKKAGNAMWGEVARLVFYASDQADVRSWNLLPRDLQIARITVDPGIYDVKVLPEGAKELAGKTIQVRAGKKVFVNFRYVPPVF